MYSSESSQAGYFVITEACLELAVWLHNIPDTRLFASAEKYEGISKSPLSTLL